MKQPHLSATCTICGATGYEANRPCPLHAAAPALLSALEGIATMHVDEGTDHHQLSALCMAIALTAIEAAKGDA